MVQYEETPIAKRTCRVKPREEVCERCKRDYVMYKAHYNCKTCEEFSKRRELIHVGIGTGEFGDDFALVAMDDGIKRIALDRIRDIQEG